MSLVQLYIPSEVSHDTIYELAEMSNFQFKDVSLPPTREETHNSSTRSCPRSSARLLHVSAALLRWPVVSACSST